MTERIVSWIEGGTINSWVIGGPWIWPILEILHFIGLSMLLGSILIVDLRLAGWLRGIRAASVLRLLPLAAAGFLLNLITGTLFFFGDPARYAINIGFQIKMLLVVLAGLNALWFYFRIEPYIAAWEPHGSTPMHARLVGLSSLATWLGVLLLGRLIPYIGTG